MESISQLRQMMADQKFYEVQRLIEVQLTLQSVDRFELLKIYSESLKVQHKNLSVQLGLELAQYESKAKNHEVVLQLIHELPFKDQQKNFNKIKQLIVKAGEDQGQMDEIYLQVSDFLIKQFEKRTPYIPIWIDQPIEKYFKHDFNLKLKELALALMVNDLSQAESLVQNLIFSCMEKSSPKGTASKLLAVGEVLQSGSQKGILEIYQNFCFISYRGITDSSDYKRLVEMVIYFEDFKLQVLLLNLMHKIGLENEASLFAPAIKKNPKYNFVYLDKYFSHLKSYFIQQEAPAPHEQSKPFIHTEIAAINNYDEEAMSPALDIENFDDELSYFQILKYQNYTTDQLCDLAVSFLQSEMPRVALKASDLAIKQSADDYSFLKGSYLKLTALLQIKDYRAALDTCLVALAKATTQNDMLSFMYGQAEVLIRLNDLTAAKKVLSRILSIDSQYRMAKERLEKL